MTKKILITLFIATLALTGCNTKKEESSKKKKLDEVKVTVGNEKGEDTKKTNDIHEEGHGDHKSDTIIHLMTDAVKANAESTLKVHLIQKDEGLTGAKVQLEIWKEADEKHEFIPVAEGDKGEYVAKHTFKEPGVYNVKTHVQKGEIHEHKEEKVEVG